MALEGYWWRFNGVKTPPKKKKVGELKIRFTGFQGPPRKTKKILPKILNRNLNPKKPQRPQEDHLRNEQMLQPPDFSQIVGTALSKQLGIWQSVDGTKQLDETYLLDVRTAGSVFPQTTFQRSFRTSKSKVWMQDFRRLLWY